MSSISSLFHLPPSEFIKELDKITKEIDQGKELVHTADDRLTTQDATGLSYPAIGDTPPKETLKLLHDLFMIRLTIQKLDLATTHKQQLSTIVHFCDKIILGNPINPNPRSATQINLLQAINFADSGVTALWSKVVEQWGMFVENLSVLPKQEEVSKLFQSLLVSPELLKKAFLDSAKKGHFEIVRVLSEDKRISNEMRTTALVTAAENGHQEVVMLFASKNLKANITYKAICAAARSDHMEIVKLLLATIPNCSAGLFALGIDEIIDILMKKDIELFKSILQDVRFRFNSCSAFENACGMGCATVVELLLQHAPPYNGAKAWGNGFYRACSYGHTHVVKVLLKDKRIDPKDGTCLVCAAENGHYDVVSLLLADERVLFESESEAVVAAAANGHINVVQLFADNSKDQELTLQQAITAASGSNAQGHLEVVKALAPVVGKKALNMALCTAVSKGCADSVDFLLQDNRISLQDVEGKPFTDALCHSYRKKDLTNMLLNLLNDRRFNAQRALQLAIQDDIFTRVCRNETLNMLLKHKRTKADELLLSCLKQIEQPACKLFVEAACKTDMKLYGLPLKRIIPNSSDRIESLVAYVRNPVAYLNNMKDFIKNTYELKEQPIPKNVISAVQILKTAKVLKSYKRKLAQAERERNRFVNVDDQARIGTVRTHFKNIIQPHFNAAFTSYGTSQEERISAIEYQMREMFLAEIAQEVKSTADTHCQAILEFINGLNEEQKGKLLKGNDPASMAQARNLFSDATSAAQTAWRAYDKWAEVGGEWPNLLTPPLQDADKPVFTVGAVGIQEPTTQMASDLSREIVAYSFLMTIDKNDGDDEARATRKTAFIAKVAEVRRAHNSKEGEKDDPSCLPGTFSRAGDMWVAHAKSIIPDAPQLLEEELRTLVIEQFQKYPKYEQLELQQAILNTGNYDEQLSVFLNGLIQEATTPVHELYNALVMLSSHNAEDVIEGKVPFTDEQVALRNAFVKKVIGNSEQFKVTINQRLTTRGSRVLTDGEFQIYSSSLLADIGGPWIVAQLTAIFRSASKLENPFTYTAPQGMSQQAGIAMLMKLLATVQMDNKMRFIMDMAQTYASGNMQLANAKLVEVGVQPNSIQNALNDVEKTKSQAAEKRQRKAALWDKLYGDLKNNPIQNKAELLKDIVDEVIDGNQDLNDLLKQHNLAE